MAKFGKAGPLLEGTAYGVLNEILSEFRSGDGYARPSRYEILIQPPNGFAGEGRSELKNIWGLIMNQNSRDGTVRRTSLRCSQISFPGRTIETTPDTNMTGPVRNIATGYSYGTVTANFQCSPDMREKRLFETWQRLTYNPQTWAMQYYHNYVGALDIFSLNRKDKRKYGVQLVECFPTAIAEQQLDAAQGQLQLIGVTFSYRYWVNFFLDRAGQVDVGSADFKQPTVKRAGGIFGGLISKLPPEIRRAGRDVLNELRRKAPIGRVTGGRVFPPFRIPPLNI